MNLAKKISTQNFDFQIQNSVCADAAKSGIARILFQEAAENMSKPFCFSSQHDVLPSDLLFYAIAKDFCWRIVSKKDALIAYASITGWLSLAAGFEARLHTLPQSPFAENFLKKLRYLPSTEYL